MVPASRRAGYVDSFMISFLLIQIHMATGSYCIRRHRFGVFHATLLSQGSDTRSAPLYGWLCPFKKVILKAS